jgi:TP901 family phage tail tape measure protein
VPVFLDIGLQLAKQDGDKAAKAISDWATDAAKEINSTLGGALGKVFESIDGSKGRNELKAMQDEYAKLAKAAADAERVQTTSAGNVEVAIKRLSEIHDKYGASASQTAAAENRVTAAWAQSSQAALAAAAATQAASGAHDALAKASTGAAGAAEGMGGSMLLAAGGVAAVGVAAVEATRKLYEMGEQWADVSDKITFSTGKMGADAAAMTDAVAKIADHTAAPVNVVAEVYTQLTRLKELQGQTLDDLTKQVSDYDQMATKVGEDPLNLGVFTRLMQEFHTPASEVGTDLDTLVKAAQDGQVPLNELTQTMQTFGPTADLMGLSFAQTSNLLAVLDETGANVDKTLQSFRIGLTSIAKDSPALQKQIKFGPDENDLQRLKDVVAQMKQLYDENTTASNNAADKLGAAVFGRTWQTVADAIKDGKLNLDDLNSSADASPGKIEAMRAATERFGDDWQKVKNQIGDALKPLSENVFGYLDEQLKSFSGDLDVFLGSHSWDDFTKLFFDPKHSMFGDSPSFSDGPPHGGSSGHGFGVTPDISQDQQRPDAPSAPTGPNIPTAKPYYPLDLNPADKPPGAETYDEWVSSQKAVQSALNAQADSGERVAALQQKQKELLDSGTAKQDELNSIADELSTAQRQKLQADQDYTIATNKYVEDANKTKKGKNPFDDYDPFKEATKHSTGLIPQLAGLLAAGAVNQALGNPYGKLQAAKKGEDPSNPLYVSEVAGGGVPGYLSKVFANNAIGQAPSPDTGTVPPSDAPAGSIPQIVAGKPKAPAAPAAPKAGEPSASPEVALQAYSQPLPGKPGYTTDAALLAQIPSGSYSEPGSGAWDLKKGLGDCSSAIEDLVNIMDGKSTAGRSMATGNEADWLSQRGFLPGDGGPGDFRVGFNSHHTQATLPGGTNFNWGSDAAAQARGVGPNAGAGAFDPAFTSHYYRPEMPQGYATGGTVAASDTVPAMLTPGEEVVKKDAAQKYRPELEAMNAGHDPHKPTPDRVSPNPTGPGASSRGPLGSVTPPPPGPRIGQGQGPGFGISGGIIGLAESAAIMAAMGAAGMADGGIVPGDLGASAGTPIGGAAPPGGGGGGKSGAPSGGGGDPMTAVLNRTIGYGGQLIGIGAQGLMSSLIPGASQKGGISDGGILSKLAGGIAGAHPSAPNTAGNTAVPLPPPGGGPGSAGDTHNHIGMQAGVSIGTLVNQNGQSGTDLANDLAFKGYSGYGGR